MRLEPPAARYSVAFPSKHVIANTLDDVFVAERYGSAVVLDFAAIGKRLSNSTPKPLLNVTEIRSDGASAGDAAADEATAVRIRFDWAGA
jgi:hypothetical protein